MTAKAPEAPEDEPEAVAPELPAAAADETVGCATPASTTTARATPARGPGRALPGLAADRRPLRRQAEPRAGGAAEQDGREHHGWRSRGGNYLA